MITVVIYVLMYTAYYNGASGSHSEHEASDEDSELNEALILVQLLRKVTELPQVIQLATTVAPASQAPAQPVPGFSFPELYRRSYNDYAMDPRNLKPYQGRRLDPELPQLIQMATIVAPASQVPAQLEPGFGYPAVYRRSYNDYAMEPTNLKSYQPHVRRLGYLPQRPFLYYAQAEDTSVSTKTTLTTKSTTTSAPTKPTLRSTSYAISRQPIVQSSKIEHLKLEPKKKVLLRPGNVHQLSNTLIDNKRKPPLRNAVERINANTLSTTLDEDPIQSQVKKELEREMQTRLTASTKTRLVTRTGPTRIFMVRSTPLSVPLSENNAYCFLEPDSPLCRTP